MRKLARALLTTSSSSAAAILLSVVTTKVVAILLGPTGVGLLSLLRQARQTAVTVGSFNAAPGIARGIAARNPEDRRSFVATALTSLLAGGGAASLVAIAAAFLAAPEFLGDTGIPATLVAWLSIPILLGVLQVYFNGIMQGYRNVGQYSVAQLAIAATTALTALPATYLVSLGYPMAFIGMMSVSALAGLAVSWRSLKRLYPDWLPSRLWPLRIDRQSLRELLAVSAAAFASASGETITVLITRFFVARTHGVTAAGVFDAAWTLSMTYVMLVLSSFGTYYLPTVTAASEAERAEISTSMMRLTAIVLVPMVTAVVALKPLLVSALYSPEFLDALPVIRWMLIGDYLKVACWVLLIPLLGTGQLRKFIAAEFAREVAFLAAVAGLASTAAGLELIGVAFMATYAAQLGVLLYRGRAQSHESFKVAVRWLFVGLGVVIAASLVTWKHRSVYPTLALMLLASSTAFSWTALRPAERNWIAQRLTSVRRREPKHGP